jgi:hypothetical protein
MAGFAAAAPLGLIDHLQDGELGTLYTPRTVVVGGNTPFVITISNGNLPPGLAIDPPSGVLIGTPTCGWQLQLYGPGDRCRQHYR